MADLTYWQKRHLKTKQKALKNAENYEEDYQKRLKKAQREIEQEIQAWVGKYATEDGDLTPQGANKILKGQDKKTWNNTLDEWERKSLEGGYDQELNLEYYRSRVSRLQALEGQISNIMAEHTAPEVERMKEQLSSTYKETYHQTTYNTQQQTNNFSGDFAKLNSDQLAKVVSKPWAGSNFSKRLWGNMTQQLPNKLAKTLSRGVLLGHGVDRMVKDSRVVFKNASSRDIHRLITTEFAHIAEQATLDSYHDTGIEKYEYMATLESRTCDYCRGLDGKVFDTKKQETGVNYPPMHPHCRCTTAPWFAELGDDVVEENLDVNEDENDVVFGENVEKLLSDEQTSIYKGMLNNAPDDIQALFKRQNEHLVLGDASYNGTANFNATRNSVLMNVSEDLKGSTIDNAGNTFFHEFAHQIDAKNGFVSMKAKLRDTMVEDWKTYTSDYKKTLSAEYKKIGKEEFQEKHDLSSMWSNKTLKKADADEIMWKELKSLPLKERASISDWLEYPLKKDSPLGAGHGAAYHHRGYDATSLEIFAEITSARVTNPEALKVMKKLFPDTIKAYNEILKELI
ncbi:minor capsid protein [Weissella ceti]|uniref:Minor capsid protein n=1 Tax=Weissella ceti TaxID=759620 RepID=A0ABT3E4N7_9LACO|nr:minor capsid protein [Weissella ceti]MCW0953199.1 minor capsid protein [Weissella ceti]QVK12716.1 minor capsid protein [Weissella ceti]